MAAPAPSYLDTNILHARPLAVHLFKGVQIAGLEINTYAHVENWRGRAIGYAAGGIGITGQALSIVLGTVELLGAFSLGLVGLLFLKGEIIQSEILEKYTIKMLAHGLNSLILIIGSVTAIYHNIFLLPSRFALEFVDQSLYLLSASIAQLTMNESRTRLPFDEGRDEAMSRILESTGIFQYLDNTHEMQALLLRMPPDHQAVLLRIIQNPSQLINIENLQLIVGIIQSALLNERIVYQEELIEQDYRNKICLYAETTIKVLYEDDKLVRHLRDENNVRPEKTDVEAGREALLDQDAHCFIPVSNLIQYMELSKPENSCPPVFKSGYMKEFNAVDGHQSRHAKIDEARALLKNMDVRDQEELLIERLITTKEMDFSRIQVSESGNLTPEDRFEMINALYADISQLSTSLYQGRLMCRKVTLNTLTGDTKSDNALFTKWQEISEQLNRK